MQPNRLLGVLGEHEEDFPIERLALSRDRRYLASCSHDQTVKFWDALELCEVCSSFFYFLHTLNLTALVFLLFIDMYIHHTLILTALVILSSRVSFMRVIYSIVCFSRFVFCLIQDDGAGAAAGAASDDEELGAADVSGDDDGEDEDGMSEEEDEDARVAAALAAADARSANVCAWSSGISPLLCALCFRAIFSY